MTTSTTLYEFLLNLLGNPSAIAAYRDDPEGYLASCGESLSPESVRDALVQLQDNQDGDFQREQNSGSNVQVHVPPPPPAPEPEPGESDQEAAVRYLNTYVTNNYVDDRDTHVDNSLNQQIDTGGGNFDQDIDIDSTVASGDDSVAAGEDIEDSDIVTGDDNTVGDDNIDGDDNEAVFGDDNTTSFGDGDASSTEIDGDVDLDDGSAFASGGSAGSETTDNSVSDSYNDNSSQSVEDSYNDTTDVTDTSNNSVNDSLNTSDDDAYSAQASDNDTYTDSSETTTGSHNSTEESFETQTM
ncbi:MAG: hypothetical protein ACRDXB_01905 [Actinomycetes bacterium]